MTERRKTEIQIGKLPPQAVELEEAVLGALMLEKEAIIQVIGILRDESFYKYANRLIFEAITELFTANEAIDILTVTNRLRKNGKLEEAGGAFYITELTSKVSSSANLEFHARVVVEMAMKRDMIRISSEIQKQSYEDTTDAFEILDYVATEIMAIDGSITASKSVKVTQSMKEVAKKIERASKQESGITGITSGYFAVDQVTRGWQNSDLMILAARPAMGKSDLALNFAVNASNAGHVVAFFSLEMSTVQLTERILAMSMKIDRERIKSGKLFDTEWMLLTNFPYKLGDKLIIQDEPDLSAIKFRAIAKKLKASEKIEMIIIDYLQLMSGSMKGNREQEISQISRTLKLVAKELNIPIIALSQLSRAVETRGGDKKPMLSDLRESGAIEQDADIVIFPFRPQYYGVMEREDGTTTQQLMEVDFAKNRHGKVGPVDLRYLGAYGKVEDWIDSKPYDNSYNKPESSEKQEVYRTDKFKSNGASDFDVAPF